MMNVDSGTVKTVTKMVTGYTSIFSDEDAFEYDLYVPFHPNLKLPIFYVSCWRKLGIHPLTTEDSDGFADKRFLIKGPGLCDCLGHLDLTKDQLRRHLYSRDFKSDKKVYTRIKYFGFDLGNDVVVDGMLPNLPCPPVGFQV